MRQIFSSPRLENVERVEQLLEENGIQTKVSDRSTWNRATKRDFSYTDRTPAAGRWPAVWIVVADDYPKARQLLREIGLIEPPRGGAADAARGPSYVEAAANETPYVAPERKASRLRLVIFAITLGLAVVVVMRMAGL